MLYTVIYGGLLLESNRRGDSNSNPKHMLLGEILGIKTFLAFETQSKMSPPPTYYILLTQPGVNVEWKCSVIKISETNFSDLRTGDKIGDKP